MKFRSAFFTLLAAACLLIPSRVVAARIEPGDSRVQYLGRFHLGNSGPAKFNWSGSTIRFQLNARRAEVMLGGAAVRYAIFINGKPASEWLGTPDIRPLSIEVPPDIPMPVTVEVIRLNQPLFGLSLFSGIEVLSETDLLPPPEKPSRWIEFIGDSITAGHGNEAASKDAPLKVETENVTKTYAFLASKALQAQPVVEAWSGIRLTRGQPEEVTMPDRWGRTLADAASKPWDFSIIPGVVVINLGTNDFSRNPPDEATWTKDYRDFLGTLRGKYPGAWIICSNGPMLGGDALQKLKAWTDALVKEQSAAGDSRISTLYFSPQRREDGIGGQWHPSLRTHAIMAKRLSEEIADKAGWSADAVEIPPVTQTVP